MNIKTECHGWDNWLAFDVDIDPESDEYVVGYGKNQTDAIFDYWEQFHGREGVVVT